jgi:hypothetical protein
MYVVHCISMHSHTNDTTKKNNQFHISTSSTMCMNRKIHVCSGAKLKSIDIKHILYYANALSFTPIVL